MSKIFVGLSGGVDSSVTAALLKQQSLRDSSLCVEAVFMQNWRGQDEKCTIKDDYNDAKKIAQQLDMRLHFVDFADRYWDDVFEFFLSEIECGRTPNPDILCNQHVKFDAFFNWARSEGADKIATGHYAQMLEGRLSQAIDSSKDQSYFLWAVPSETLQHCLFPLGSWHKSAVRQWAHEHHLMTHNKKDSTGICFIGPKNFRTFLKQYLCAKAGPIVDERGHYLGEHQGALFYTLGQRSGLNIGGQSGMAQLPWYVIAKDLSSNTIVVAQDQDHPNLLSSTLKAHGLVWHVNNTPIPSKIQLRFRHLQPLLSADLCVSDDKKTMEVHFDKEQRAINAGQAVVVYDGPHCVVGGWID